MRLVGRGSVLAGCIALTAAGCASTSSRTPQLRPAFAPPPAPPPPTAAELLAAEFAWSTHAGTGGVQGRIAYRSAAGSWTCGGQSVALTPATRTSAAHMRALYGSDTAAIEPVAAVRARHGEGAGVDLSPWLRSTTCDAKGEFAFRELPQGGYYVIAPGRVRHRGESEAAALVFMRRIEVRDGLVLEITLPERPAPY